jgi:hypothetical protein
VSNRKEITNRSRSLPKDLASMPDLALDWSHTGERKSEATEKLKRQSATTTGKGVPWRAPVRLKTRAHSCTNGKHKMEILSWETDSRRNEKKQPSGRTSPEARDDRKAGNTNRQWKRMRAGVCVAVAFLCT